MRYLGVSDVKDIATGASLVGAGGGGDPYIGELMAVSAIKKYGKVKVLSVDEVDDKDVFVPAASVGAPSIATEKVPKGDEFEKAFEALEAYNHQKFSGTFPIEAGGMNSMMPIVLAAKKRLPLIDCDAMGRAFPGIQMTTLAINGVKASPASVADEKGNASIVNTINPTWSERIIRSMCVEMGGTCSTSQYVATGKQLKDYGIHNIINLCEKIGRLVHNVPYSQGDTLQDILDLTHGYHLFDGKVVDVTHQVEHGFNYGTIQLKGIGEDSGDKFSIDFQNENLIAFQNGRAVTTVPDLICLADYDTLVPSDAEDIKYGKRITVLGLPSSDKWRTSQGMDVVSPRSFGYDLDYVPVEKLQAKGED